MSKGSFDKSASTDIFANSFRGQLIGILSQRENKIISSKWHFTIIAFLLSILVSFSSSTLANLFCRGVLVTSALVEEGNLPTAFKLIAITFPVSLISYSAITSGSLPSTIMTPAPKDTLPSRNSSETSTNSPTASKPVNSTIVFIIGVTKSFPL